ncbi:hypothetical protein K439DRAFT_1635577 [Ramaria rubella]|nr:hypothetical protein K439DRAFT_1635568 [Ramaria rubella]KAF8582120.1 hypothetical protein K439DRAFT_1635577 [Ramaria rubella]
MRFTGVFAFATVFSALFGHVSPAPTTIQGNELDLSAPTTIRPPELDSRAPTPSLVPKAYCGEHKDLVC